MFHKEVRIIIHMAAKVEKALLVEQSEEHVVGHWKILINHGEMKKWEGIEIP